MHKYKNIEYYLVVILVLCLDQITKYYATIHLIAYQPYNILPLVNFTLVYNTGAAFSFLVGAGAWHYWFLLCVSIIMSIILSIWLYKTKDNYIQALGIALILGGAVGNLYDRASLSYVIDFIDVYYKHYHWPIFNIADSAICSGAILLCINNTKS